MQVWAQGTSASFLAARWGLGPAIPTGFKSRDLLGFVCIALHGNRGAAMRGYQALHTLRSRAPRAGFSDVQNSLLEFPSAWLPLSYP